MDQSAQAEVVLEDCMLNMACPMVEVVLEYVWQLCSIFSCCLSAFHCSPWHNDFLSSKMPARPGPAEYFDDPIDSKGNGSPVK